MIKYEYQLLEILNALNETNHSGIIPLWKSNLSFLTCMKNMLGGDGEITSTSFAHLSFVEYKNNQWQLKAHVDDVFSLIYRRYYDWYCESLDEDDTSFASIEFMVRIIDVMDTTYKKYASTLNAFDQVANDLMAKVKAGTKTETGFNDTPQDEGDFTDATHRSSYSSINVESDTDAGTPADRLDEIQNKIRNIMLDWCNEFRRLFWYEV